MTHVNPNSCNERVKSYDYFDVKYYKRYKSVSIKYKLFSSKITYAYVDVYEKKVE